MWDVHDLERKPVDENRLRYHSGEASWSCHPRDGLKVE
jgi:hypothetical protein